MQSRAARVARGFFRIALAGAVVGIIGAIAFDILALQAHLADLIVVTDKGTVSFPKNMKDGEINKALVTAFGAPEPNPFDKYAAFSKLEGLPYAQAIANARSVETSAIRADKQVMRAWLIFAGVWFSVWLGLSWIIRGFMVD